MARTLTEIYELAKETRNQYLEIYEIDNPSKMSIMDSFTWTVAACIWSFETILDVFKVDIAKDLQNRVNGTPAYYANALLKYQSGDELIINEDGTSFSYQSLDEGKRIIKKVSYSEHSEDNHYDKYLMLKVASGEPGSYEKVSDDELMSVRAYVNKIKFAGTDVRVVSRNGDILMPYLTVYYDGAVASSVVYDGIENALNEFIAGVGFDGSVYVQKIIDAIQSVEHVVDVHIGNQQGVYVAQYDDDNQVSSPQKIERFFVPNSGFLKQSTKDGAEVNFPLWRESITLTIEQ